MPVWKKLIVKPEGKYIGWSCVIHSALTAFSLVRLTGVSTFNILGLIAFISFYLLNKNGWYYTKEALEVRMVSNVLSVLYALFSLMGAWDTIGGGLNSIIFIAPVFLLTGLGLFILGTRLVTAFILWGTGKIDDGGCYNDSVGFSKNTLMLFFLTLVLTRLPWLLLNAPGIMTVDSLNQYGQLRGFLPLSNHHPFAHTFLMGIFFDLGRALTGRDEPGILLFTIFQVVICSLIHTYGAAVMGKLGAKKPFLILYWAFYGLVPYNFYYAITLWKDILFSAAVALFTTVILCFKADNIKITKVTYFLFIISALAMCLFRSNGFMAFAATLPFLVLIIKKYRAVIASWGTLVIILSLIITGPVYNSLSLERGDTVEALSIPLQMAARVFAEDEPVSPRHREAFDRILDTGKIKAVYQDFCSDNMKNLVREGDQEYLSLHLKETAILWVEFGLSHPLSYIKGFIDATRGFYYPDIPNLIGADYSIAANDYGLKPLNIIHNPGTIKIEEIILKFQGLLPLYGYLYSPGMFFWIFLALAGLCFVKKGPGALVIFLPNLMVFATLMAATPVNNEFRYIYSLVLSMPLYFGWAGLLSEDKELYRGKIENTPD